MGTRPGVPISDIRNTYRKKSLLIHPDKTKNPQAPDAFDRLKKAESDLMDDGKRQQLDDCISDAYKLVMKDHKFKPDNEETKEDWFWDEVQIKTRTVLIEDELRRRKTRQLAMAQEGREKAKEDDAVAEFKRKREHEKEWEQTREERISSWRDFKQKGADQKAKKKKMKLLG